jgi:monofunctional biosynthetic peptidoglycan transglycosylase
MGRLVHWVERLLLAFAVLSVAAVLAVRWLDPPLTPLMAIRAVGTMAAQQPVKLQQHWVPLEAVSPSLLRALIVAEDARFLEHHGVDWQALVHARDWNLGRRDGRRRGGSTITMQCARNVFLWPGRSYLRKVLEMYFAYLIDFVWGKRRTLEVYVNVVEWGDGIYGAEAASRHWFGVPASGLDARQAALLAAVLPAPLRWSPAAPTSYVRSRAARIETRAAGVALRGL